MQIFTLGRLVGVIQIWTGVYLVEKVQERTIL